MKDFYYQRSSQSCRAYDENSQSFWHYICMSRHFSNWSDVIPATDLLCAELLYWPPFFFKKTTTTTTCHFCPDTCPSHNFLSGNGPKMVGRCLMSDRYFHALSCILMSCYEIPPNAKERTEAHIRIQGSHRGRLWATFTELWLSSFICYCECHTKETWDFQRWCL